jgi:hypothetical protein
MFDLFGIKRLKMKKQEIEEALSRANAANREMGVLVKNLQNKIVVLSNELIEAKNVIKQLESEIILRRSHDNARKRYNDENKYY